MLSAGIPAKGFACERAIERERGEETSQSGERRPEERREAEGLKRRKGRRMHIVCVCVCVYV
jgi:IS5 family transposase